MISSAIWDKLSRSQFFSQNKYRLWLMIHMQFDFGFLHSISTFFTQVSTFCTVWDKSNLIAHYPETNSLHKSHNTPILPQKICIGIVVVQTMIMQNFGGCYMGFVQVVCGESNCDLDPNTRLVTRLPAPARNTYFIG